MRMRFNDPNTELKFVNESIRGTTDIITQQLSQGSIGEMSRNARISSSLFYRDRDGVLKCMTSKGPIIISDVRQPDIGFPSNRAVMLLCSKAQQAKLDAHRTGATQDGGFDMITDLFKGVSRSPGDNRYVTLCCFRSIEHVNRHNIIWKTTDDDIWVTLVTPKSMKDAEFVDCIASYSPIVLRLMPVDTVWKMCVRAIVVVCNYYGIKMSAIELTDLAWCISYQPGASEYPIFTRDGLVMRNLGWIETLLANNYTMIDSLECFKEEPRTSTPSMFMSNFDHVTHSEGGCPNVEIDKAILDCYRS